MSPRILLAPDKFKGSLTAAEVRTACENGLRLVFPNAQFTDAAVADGGEGTTEAIRSALGGSTETVAVQDPLGRPIEAEFSLVQIGGKTVAVMEMSAASGFEKVLDVPPHPERASTFGTGQMIQAATQLGAEQILIGIGGSATNDGGVGMAQALQFRFFQDDGIPLSDLPTDLERLTRIESTSPFDLPPILVACDVDSPLLGERGATRIYGPQKGIQEDQFPLFESRLEALAVAASEFTGTDHRDHPGAGAAGGLGFGLMTFCGATLHPGFDLVADITGLHEQIAKADLVLTGEGSLDSQTLNGKGPAGVAALARAAGNPVIALCGITDPDVPELAKAFDLVLPIKDDSLSTEESISRAAELLTARIARASDFIQALVE